MCAFRAVGWQHRTQMVKKGASQKKFPMNTGRVGICLQNININNKVTLQQQQQQQQQQQSFYGPLSGTTRLRLYLKKHSPTHHSDHHPIFISFFHLPRSIASSLFKLRAWQSLCTTSFHVLFGLPLGLEPFTSYSIHFFTHSVSSFHNTCPYHRNLFCCSINIISSIPSFSLNSLLGSLSFTLTLHIHLTILISAS